jgi:hypothetical protein
MMVSAAGEISVIAGGTLSGIDGSYLIWTCRVQEFAAGAESIAMNRMSFHSDGRRPITVAAFYVSLDLKTGKVSDIISHFTAAIPLSSVHETVIW